MKRGVVTMLEIAKEMEVSVTTVSRALSGSNLVRKEVSDGIKALAIKYNYVPNYQALSLKYRRTNTIGIVLPKPDHDFFARIVRGVEEYAQKHQYNVILCPTYDSYEREVTHVNKLISGRVDGLLICVSNETKDFDHLRSCMDRKVPIVCFDCDSDELETPKVLLDDVDAGFKAVNHLIEQGCKQIAYLGGPRDVSVNRNRLKGYLKALSEVGLSPANELIKHCDPDSFENGLECSKEILSSGNVDGIFAGTDLLAISAIKCAKSFGLSVPHDLAVVGFSNWSIGHFYEPSLTTMSQPGEEMGRLAAQSLLNQIQSPNEGQENEIILKSSLVIRESSRKIN